MKTCKYFPRGVLILFLAALSPTQAVYAEDIDIYSRPPSSTSDPALNPNILIVIDNSANWSAANQGWPDGYKQGESELKALASVISTVNPNTNIGLMMFTPGGGASPSGGYVRYHIRPMSTTNKHAITELIGDANCIPGSNSLNGTPNCMLNNFNGSEKVASAKTDYSAVMLEVFKYFGGYTWPAHAHDDEAGVPVNSSQFGAKRYAGDPDPKSDPFAYLLLDGSRAHDAYMDNNGTPADISDDFFVAALKSDDPNLTNYTTPLSPANSCAKNYVIFIGNGFPSQDSPPERLGPPSLLTAQGVGGDVTQLPVPNLTKDTQIVTGITLAAPECGKYVGTTADLSRQACEKKIGGTFTVTATSPAVFTRTAHGLDAGDPIKISTTGSLPKGLDPTNTYYVLASGLTADSFYVSLSDGGVAVDASGAQSGTHRLSNLEALYPGYTNYACTDNTTCTAGTTQIVPIDKGRTSCNAYPTKTACETALKDAFPGYDSYACSAGIACSIQETLQGADTLVTAQSACMNATNTSGCESLAPSLYPGYASYSCSNKSNTLCSGNDNTFRIEAGYRVTNGFEFDRTVYESRLTTSNSFSQYITGTKTYIAATPNGTYSAPSKPNYFDEWARFLNQTDVSSAPGRQNITTFTIDVFKDAQDVDQSQLLISAAQAGGGKYFTASDEQGIKNALNRIISEIQSVNTVFASSSLPVSVNTQGTYLNQVFMGMFRPEGGASPRWPGNLKQYKFKIFNGVLRLADKNGEEAISSTTGFVTPCADSFWTTDTGDYWNFGGSRALGGCNAELSAFPSAGSISTYSDAPDGEVVEKGGAAQRLRGVYSDPATATLTPKSTRYAVCTGTQTPSTDVCRKLFTCDGSSATSCSAFTNFDTTNVALNATSLNLADPTQVNSLINWTRGEDVDNENANLSASSVPVTDEMRPSVHGGVVHSQPAVIDYGGSIGTIAFYGADDGVFHAVDGGQTNDDGIELWGFIAPETVGKLNRLRTNSPPISFPGVSGTPTPTPKDYFFDGSIGVYQNAVTGTVWIYSSMRRGGRSIYAFDVTNPSSPVLKWRKGCFTSNTADDTMCSTDTSFPDEWAKIGQTWSHPTITYIKGFVDGSNNPKPVLIFGGGYDKCEDANSQTRCTTTPRKGANIWFVDAANGNIIRTYPTHYSVAGDLAEIKDSNGYLTHVYASDTGGNVYRINVGSSNTLGSVLTSWSNDASASQIIIASLSETNHARKFLNGPSVVPSSTYNAVLLGSGDREHPLVTDYACTDYSTTAGSYVTNQFYMLMDKPAAGYPTPTVAANDLVNVTSGTTTYSSASGTPTITNSLTGSSTKGWRFDFGKCEQTVNEALTIAGVTYFGTNAPSPNTSGACVANLGIARGYAVDYLNANPIPANATGVGAGSGSGTYSTNPDVGPGAVGEVINGVISGPDGGARSAEYIGGGLPPSPVAGVVDVDGTKVPFCIGCINTSAANSSALQGNEVKIKPPGNRHRSYWYMEIDDPYIP